MARWNTLARTLGYRWDSRLEAMASYRGHRAAVLSWHHAIPGQAAVLVFEWSPDVPRSGPLGRPGEYEPFCLIWGTHPDAPLLPATTSDEFVADELRLATVVAARGWPLPVRAPELGLLAARD